LIILSANVNHGVGEHLIEGINPVILAVEPIFIAKFSCDIFGLLFAAFWPNLRVVVDALLYCL
jgi:hypothetical protein